MGLPITFAFIYCLFILSLFQEVQIYLHDVPSHSPPPRYLIMLSSQQACEVDQSLQNIFAWGFAVSSVGSD